MKKKCCNDCLSCILLVASYVLCAVIFICLGSIIVIWLESLCQYHLRVDSEGIKSMLNFWSEYKPLFSVLGTCLTLLIISTNLRKYIDVETVKTLGILRERFQGEEKMKIHDTLLDNDDKKTIIEDLSNVEILDYLGTLELGAIMLDRCVITKDEFCQQFGYRVENIRNNREIMKHIEENKQYYKYLLKLLKGKTICS